MPWRPLPLASASLYIHIPFCVQKCAYCDFYSVPADTAGAQTREAIQAVLEAEIRQFDYYREEWRPAKIPSVYIGGGTPSLIPPPLLEKFLAGIKKRLPAPPLEFTIEANPESLSEEFLGVCTASGVTRLSLGLQTFDPRCLEALGRRASPEDNRRALRLLDTLWKGEISLDLMYGLPGQTGRGACADTAEALEGKPGHISLYALTLEEGTPLYSAIQAGKIQAADEARQEAV
ncbi:MAG: radical SAM protein, partial [Spirochaetales bacterium]|nr:radical SAM protein [Spirochaetales bacterium]